MIDKPTYEELENQIVKLKRQNEIYRLNSIADISVNEKIYRLLIDNEVFPIIITSFEGKILFINECAKNYFGLDIHNLQNFNSSDLWVSAEKRNEFIAHLKLINLVQNLEAEIFNKNKEINTVLVSSQIIDYDEQKALITIFNDITEKKKAEKALYKSNQLLNRTFASLHDAVFIFDAKTTTIINCNSAATTNFGYPREEILRKTTDFIYTNIDVLQR